MHTVYMLWIVFSCTMVHIDTYTTQKACMDTGQGIIDQQPMLDLGARAVAVCVSKDVPK